MFPRHAIRLCKFITIVEIGMGLDYVQLTLVFDFVEKEEVREEIS